jgi:ribosomal protein L11 methylase PrmA
MSHDRIPGSFRDPSGFLFVADGVVHRQVNAGGAALYDQLMASGLYRSLVDAGLLVAHEEVELRLPAEAAPAAHRVIRPERIPFISYPYEWSFGQLKAAAKLTLAIQKAAIDKGMVLRDASAYNVQFLGCKPVFIDTLSFGPYVEGEPWVAYQQFCKHFLAPLALMAKTDVGLSQLMRVHIDGVPLDLAAKLLPFGTKLSFGLLTHLHLHARSTVKWADSAAEPATKAAKPTGISKTAMLGLIDSLGSAVDGLDWLPAGTEWGDYYDKTNYTADAHATKKRLVGEFLAQVQPLATVWDLGANTGMFSRIAAEAGARVMSFDVDPAAVERNFREGAKTDERRILPLLQDLTNPSAGIGWGNDERASLAARGPADAVLALALIHHLAISNNVPLDRIAAFFRQLAKHLVIEFVPKSDSQVKRLLATREDVFPDYTEAGFEAAFARFFTVRERHAVVGSERSLWLLEGR